MTNNAETKNNLIKEAQRIEEDSLYSSKGHFCAAHFWTKFHLWLGVPTAVFAAIAGASALARFDASNIVAGVLAILVAALAAVSTFLNPNEKANVHLNAGNDYNSLRNKARIFHEIEIETSNLPALSKKLKELNNERDDLNRNSPQIPNRAFQKARKGIEEGEAHYAADE